MTDQDPGPSPAAGEVSASAAQAPEEQIVAAVRTGDHDRLAGLLDRHPDRLHLRSGPYEWSLLHVAAQEGHAEVVDLLLARGIDPDTRERGDNTTPMHWAAAAGHLSVVQRLAEAGGDVVGAGDDHLLEVIGWATCWYGCDDEAHRAVADYLVARGARHHVFSALAMNLADEVRRIVGENPATLELQMSRNEGFQRPLHFAIRMRRPEMVALLVALGADPAGRDGDGYTPMAYATTTDVDRPVLEALAASARLDAPCAVALGAWDAAARLLGLGEGPGEAGAIPPGPLHLMAKRGSVDGVRWLLARGADPSMRWAHWDAEVTPLHLAALGGHLEVARVLLESGADPGVRDSKFESDTLGWAEHLGLEAMAQLVRDWRPPG